MTNPAPPARHGAADWRTRSRKWLLLLGLLMFILAIVGGLRSLPERSGPTQWLPLFVVTATLAPLTLLLSGLEFASTVKLIGKRIALGDAIRVAVISSAANLLPLPGSVLVRARELNTMGSDVRTSIGSPVAVGGLWVAIAALISGAWLAIDEPTTFSWILLGGGAIVAIISLTFLRSLAGKNSWTAIGQVAVVELAMVIVSAGRYYLVLLGLGFDPEPSHAFALALSSVLATAVGLIPGGLGLREALAGTFAALVGLPAGAGFLAAVVNRIIGLIVLAAAAALLLLRSTHDEEPVDQR